MAKRKKFKKGSAEAKAFMARLRNMKKTGKRKVKRVIRSVSRNLPAIIVKGESGMDGRKRKRSRKARKARRSYGFEGRKRRRSSRRTRRYSGGIGTIAKKVKIVDTLKEMGGLGIGAIGGSMAANFVPVKSSKIKALVPILLGMIIPMLPKVGKNPIIKAAGMGSLAIGTISLIRQFVPNVPLLAGGETAETVAGAIEQLDGEQALLLGQVMEGANEFEGALVEGAGEGLMEGAGDGLYEGAVIEGIGPESYQ